MSEVDKRCIYASSEHYFGDEGEHLCLEDGTQCLQGELTTLGECYSLVQQR